jgi:CDP-2,3-bis-(O-geranylgeranyl)-sn-glycerol synthase
LAPEPALDARVSGAAPRRSVGLSELLLFLAVLGAPLVHAPVLRWDLLRGLKRPLDGGRTLGGRRLLGDNKTWRGALCMTAGVVLATVLLWRWDWWRAQLPGAVRDASPVLVGLLMGAGTVIGELPNSFLKRRLGIAPGARRRTPGGVALAVLDQGDLVLGIWVALLPIWVMPVWLAAIAFAAVAAIHLVINVIGYAIGARAAPV